MSELESSPSSDATGRETWLDVARSASRGGRSDDREGSTGLRRELLVFEIDASDYAIPVERVREIVRLRPLTRLPHTPDWLLGVVTLRGEVVEVVDLRSRLGVERIEPARSSRIVVLHGDGDRVTGVLVDGVTEVARVPEESIVPAQELEVSSVVEMFERGEGFVSILDADRVLGFPDA